MLLRRGDAQRHILAIAAVLAAHMDWETKTSRPTWPVIAREAAVLLERTTDLSESTVARWLRWLRRHGLLVIVEHGTTPRFSPGVLTTGPDGEARNAASVYLLISPDGVRAVADPHPEDTGAEWRELGPANAVEAAAQAERDGTAPPPLLAALPAGDVPLRRTRPLAKPGAPAGAQGAARRTLRHRGRSPVDISDTPTPPVGGVDPLTRAREARNRQDPAGDRPEPRWPRSKRPATRPERAAAAAEAARLAPVLRGISTAHVAALSREWHLAGWTLHDVLTALDRAPDGPAAAGYRHTDPVRHVAAWYRSRLNPWRSDPLDPTSPPGTSPTARAEAERAHDRALQRAARDRDAARRGLPARTRHEDVDEPASQLVSQDGGPAGEPGAVVELEHADVRRVPGTTTASEGASEAGAGPGRREDVARWADDVRQQLRAARARRALT